MVQTTLHATAPRRGRRIEPDEDVFEDAIPFAGVSKFPARVKCALLGWSALRDATLQATVKEN